MFTIIKFLFNACGIGLIAYSTLAWITMGFTRMDNPMNQYTEKDEKTIKWYLTAGCVLAAIGNSL